MELSFESIAPQVVLFCVTLFGSAAMQVFSLNKGFQGTVPFLRKITAKRRSSVFYARMDFFLTVFLGSFIGFVFFSPDTAQKALAAGLGWVASVNVFLNRIESANHDDHTPTDGDS